MGDEAAMEILRRNAEKIAELIVTAKKFTDGPAVLCGGLCKQEKWLRPELERLLPDTELILTTEPMIRGAVLLARR